MVKGRERAMERKDRENVDTRQRVLEAAGTLFATRGFHETTTLDICRLARANGAAVNYHFQTKENLYVHVWRHAFERSLVAHPPDGGVSSCASAEARLRGRIRALVERMLDPASIDLDIVGMEMTHPTGLLCEVIHRCVEPLYQGITDHVRELLGGGAAEQEVALCAMSVHAQCFTVHRERRNLRVGARGAPPPPPWAGVGASALAEHICRFSLAGIRNLRKQAASAAARKGEP